MKKLLFTLALFATLTAAVPATAQKHRHTPRTQMQADTATSKKTTAIEAFSDTTQADGDSITFGSNGNTVSFATGSLFDDDDWESSVKDAKFIIVGLLILFVLAPVSIIGLVLWFIYMNRKNKVRLAEIAAQHGQPIPVNIASSPVNGNAAYAPGIRHCCLGIGLAIFLGIIMDEVGFGIGALVFFIGLGKVISAYLTRSKDTTTEAEYATSETVNDDTAATTEQ